MRLHWWGYLRARWVEHLQGTRYWIELDRGDFGLLRREFRDQAVLLDRILDRVLAGHQNLDIVRWAADWGIPMAPSVEILEALEAVIAPMGALAFRRGLQAWAAETGFEEGQIRPS